MSEAEAPLRCGRCHGSYRASYEACPYCGAPAPARGVASGVLGRLGGERLMTLALIGCCVASFLVVVAQAGASAVMAPSAYTLIRFGAMFPPYVTEGAWWRLGTALFLHGGLLHLGFNAYALWQVGPLIEASFGRARFMAAFTLAGLASTLCSFLWGFVAWDVASLVPLLDPQQTAGFATPSVGMSGALTGLIGVAVSAGHKVHTSQGRRVRNAMLFWMGSIALFGFLMPGIDNAAHLGGFAVGLVLGVVLPLRDEGGVWRRRLWSGVGWASGLSLAAAVALQAWSIPAGSPADLEAYPQGIFGVTLRSGGEDAQVDGAWAACERAATRLALGDRTVAGSPRDAEEAVSACDEARSFRPMEPSAYAWSAAAHAAAGDVEGACVRLRSGRLLLESHYAKRASARQRGTVSALRQRFELVEGQVSCEGVLRWGP